MRHGRVAVWTAALGLALGMASGVAAQDAGPQDSGQQQQGQSQSTGRAVRLSDVEGQVRIGVAASDGTAQPTTDQAVANTPLFEGTVLQTGDDGRAEIQFEDGSTARIPPDSSLTLTVLQANQTELMLNSGMGYFELKGAEKVRFDGSVATGAAVLRVKLDEAPGEVAVFDGNVHLEGPNGAGADLHGGQSVKLDAQSGYNVADSVEPDSWDAWNADRDKTVNAAEASATPATSGLPDSGNPAWGDLNQSGNWYNVPGEGYVWSPYEASDASWDPYGNGYWTWAPNYGYIWASGESWGYMPYQCGLWNWYSGFGWGWAPGGSCMPWWGAGGGIWAINVGARPGGWRAPVRPPRPRGPGFPRPGGVNHLMPVVPVRRQGPATETGLPMRDRKTQVNIGGSTVRAMRPVNNNRPAYNHQPGVNPMRFNGGNNGAFGMPGVTTVGPGRQGNAPSGNQQRPVVPSVSRPAAPIGVRPSPSPASAPHFSAPPPMPHFSAPAGGGGRR